MAQEETDGRRQRSARRRQSLIEAALQVIERVGVPGVTQRAVAAEAGVPASLITYYFPTTDALVVATLTHVNDRYIALLAACEDSSDVLLALTTALSPGPAMTADSLAAEYELFLMASRRDDLAHEYTRWTDALDRAAALLATEPVRQAAIAVAIEGLFIRCYFQPDKTTPHRAAAILGHLAADPSATDATRDSGPGLPD